MQIQTHFDDGRRTTTGHAALLVGTAIAFTVLFHWIFGEVKPHFHDAVLGLAFFGGLGIAFPRQTAGYARGLRDLVSAWRKS